MPTRKQSEEAKELLDGFDWSKTDVLTDEEIIAAAKDDPDSALPSDEDLKRFDLIIPAKSRRKPPRAAAE